MSTKAALRPSSRLRTLPLKMLPTRRSSVVRSMLNSSRRAFFEDGHAGFEGFGVDDDFLVDLLDGLDQALDLLDEVGGGGADGVDDALGLLVNGDRLEGFSSSWTSAGVSRLGSRKSRLSGGSGCSAGGRLPAGARRRCSRRARFRWLCRCSYTFSEAGGFVDGLGAGLGGFLVMALGCGRVRRWGGSACRRGGAGKNFVHS